MTSTVRTADSLERGVLVINDTIHYIAFALEESIIREESNMKNNASSVYNVCLVIGDLLALLGAFVGAFLIRGHLVTAPVAYPIHIHTYITVFLSLLPFWIILFSVLGLYRSSIYERRFSELGRLLLGSFIGMLFVVFWNFLSLHPILPSKSVAIYGAGLSFVMLVILRNFARFIRTELFTYNIGLNHVLIIGNTSISNELVDNLLDSRRSGYRVVGVVGGQQALGKYIEVKLFHRFQEALEKIREPLHTIIQTELYADEARNREILEYAQTHHVAYRFVPGNTELFVGNIEVELFRNAMPVIAVHQTALVGWGRIIKRVFDIIIAAVALVVTSPIIVLIIIAELLSGGEVFFRQTRLTRFNDEFRVFKFRTLKITYNGLSPEDGFTKMGKSELSKQYRDGGDQIPNDPRFTKLGSFLRKSSIDELPQLFNVILGDLSLIGPRALVPQELSAYEKRHTILSVKSGITGLAQVSGRKHINFEERRKLDLYYVQNWTFWLDIVILIKTARVILEGS